MEQLDLILSVKRGVFRRNDTNTEVADKEFKAVRPRVITRDNSCCRFCDLKAEMQDVHHLDDDHSNNDQNNLATADPLCHGVNHIGQVGLSGEGRMIFLPEIDQRDLNHLQRTCFVVMEMGDANQKVLATKILRRLLLRAAAVEKSPWKTSAPLDFAKGLIHAGEEEYSRREIVLNGLRLMYHPKRFVRYLPYWVKNFISLPMSKWGKIYADAVKTKKV